MAGKLTQGDLAFLLIIAVEDTWPDDLKGASLANTKKWVQAGWLEIVQETKPSTGEKHDLYVVTDEGVKLLDEALALAHERSKARQPKKSDKPS